jgi:hypothetical protein
VPRRSNQKTATEGDACGLPQSQAQRAEGIAPLPRHHDFGGATNEPIAQWIIAKAREARVNFIDTAGAYIVRINRQQRQLRALTMSCKLISGAKLKSDDTEKGDAG